MNPKLDKIDRRQFLSAVGSAAAALSLGQAACTKRTLGKGQKEVLLYVGTYTTGSTSRGLYIYKLNPANFELNHFNTVEDVLDPSFIAIDKRRRFLYAVNEIKQYNGEKSGSVSAFAIDQQTGDLTFLNKQSSMGSMPCHLSISDNGRYALVANYRGGNVSVLPIGSNGELAPAVDVVQHTGTGPITVRQEAPHAHSIYLDKNNCFALACDLGADKVFIYEFDDRTGKLTPNSTQPFYQARAGAGPRHLAFHQNGRLIFLINELDSTVTSLEYDQDHGTLREIQTVSALPKDWSGVSSCAEIQLSPDGNFLYGSNRVHDSIVAFRLDQATGRLEWIEDVPTGGSFPRHFNIDLTGEFLFAANQKSDSIVSYRIDKKTGELRSTGDQTEVPAPTCLLFIPPF
jgi:6-phosphogluconolactonase